MHFRSLLAVASGILLASQIALRAEEWPSRPVHVIVPFGAGGSGDTIARIVSAHLSRSFGQQFIVEDRPGASGAIGTRAIAAATADGYTIGITNLSVLSLVPVINSVAYDPMDSFSHIAYVAGAPVVLAATPNTNVKTLDQFVKYSLLRSAFTFASSGVGSDGHLMGEAIASSLKLTVEHVPYKSTSQALVDVVGGQVPFCTFTLSSTSPFLRDGTLTAVAITSAQRLPDFPDLPTFRELGHPELEGTTWFSVSGPVGLPKNVVDKLNAEINRVVALPAVGDLFRKDGFQARPMSPSDLATFIDSENKRWKALIQHAGLDGRGG